MSVTAKNAIYDIPQKRDVQVATASGTGTINAGDWLAYSGQFLVATNSGHTAYWKASGAGVALESNPMLDQRGASVQNSALKYLAMGILHVSANFSGIPPLGLGAYPDATGSAVGGVTGLTGLGATWQTAAPVLASGATAGRAAPVATVIGSQNFSNAGTGELIIRLMPLQPDYRG